jgi:hypothetical protein
MLWRFDESEDQRDARQFHKWIMPGVTYAHWPRVSTQNGVRAMHRTRLPASVPPQTWRIRSGSDAPLPDLWRDRFSWSNERNNFIVSERMRDALSLPDDAAQFLPIVVLADDDGAARRMNYALMRVLASAPVMDRERSEFRIDARRTTPLEEFLDFSRFELDEGAVAPADLFWADEAYPLVLATDRLAARVEAAGCVGVAFDTNYAASAGARERDYLRRLPGGAALETAAYAQTWGPIGTRPARRPEDRPPFLPTPGLPPELVAIEIAIGQRLPADYMTFLLTAPGETDEQYKGPLQQRPDLILRYNIHVRDQPARFPPVEWLRGGGVWPDDWLVTGDNGSGDYWALDLSRHPPPAIYYDHEYGDARVIAPDLAALQSATITE